ncbi:MAG: zinc-finger domain-containing protein [Acetobacteraceae bacterium]|nr:zinc-finger domain-containing protein [Acetobacteraceae bacterium]
MTFRATSPTPTVGETEILTVYNRNVACDGGDGPLGHPRVWLHIPTDQTFCPYCSRIFRLAPGAGDDHGH